MAWVDDDVPSLVQRFGPEEVGRLYAIQTRSRLRASEEEGRRILAELDDDPLGWLGEAIVYHGGIDPELRLRMVIAAAEEAKEDEDLLWWIGDLPAEVLAATPGFADRLRAERHRRTGIERLFRVMDAYYRGIGESPGWWSVLDAPESS